MYLRKYFRRKALIIFCLIVFLGFGGGALITGIKNFQKLDSVQATFFNAATGTGDNCRGFAWSPNFGWISFNSSDCDLNGNGQFDDAGAPDGCPDSSVLFHDYGVNIGTGTGIFSGFAWSQNLGWIYFGPDTIMSEFGSVSQADAPEDPKQWATYDFATGQVNGWAKALSLGDNGWIKLNGSWANGVRIDSNTFDFSGFAWNGNDTGLGVGWISFNCLDMPNSCNGGSNPGTLCPVGTECLGGGTCVSTCSLTNYKVTGVTNQPPQAKNLEAPYLSNDKLCDLGARSAVLKWEFDDADTGSSESAYQIIFDDDSNPDNPLLETPKCDFSSNSVDCLVSPGVGQYPIHDTFVELEFGKHYYWWVKTWDNIDSSSEWTASTDWSADFVVPGHEYPDAEITNFRPDKPNAGENMFFEGASSIYEFSNPGLSVPCENDGEKCFWNWSVDPNYYYSINDPAATSPEITLENSDLEYNVVLTVTDKDGFKCSDSEKINPNFTLPKWVEVKGEN